MGSVPSLCRCDLDRSLGDLPRRRAPGKVRPLAQTIAPARVAPPAFFRENRASLQLCAGACRRPPENRSSPEKVMQNRRLHPAAPPQRLVDNFREPVENLSKVYRPRGLSNRSFQSIQGVVFRIAPYLASSPAAIRGETRRVPKRPRPRIFQQPRVANVPQVFPGRRGTRPQRHQAGVEGCARHQSPRSLPRTPSTPNRFAGRGPVVRPREPCCASVRLRNIGVFVARACAISSDTIARAAPPFCYHDRTRWVQPSHDCALRKQVA